jgi:hypothetical protein
MGNLEKQTMARSRIMRTGWSTCACVVVGRTFGGGVVARCKTSSIQELDRGDTLRA